MFPSTIIDGITFALRAISNHIQGYDLLLIESQTDYGEQPLFFNVYQSNSDAGVWRLCAEKDDFKFYKGLDYIATTYIHVDLQKFINQNINSIMAPEVVGNM